MRAPRWYPLAGCLGLLGLRPDQPARPAGLVPIAPHAWAWIATNDRSSNSALFVGDSIALVVDPGLTAEAAAEFLAATKAVTDRPIRYAVLTHWHPDHALGTTCLADRPFAVVAHGKTRRALAERAAQVSRALAAAAGSSADGPGGQCRVALPDQIVSAERWFDLGGRRVEVVHPGPAHTNGDLIVWEPSERVLATGDVFMHDASPDMGEADPLGWARVLDSVVRLRPNAVVAGHFGPSTPADLARFRDYLALLTRRVPEMLAAGVPGDSVPARIRMPEFAAFAQYPQFGATFAGNARRVVAELDGRAPARGQTNGFTTLATLDVGRNPHQISFSADGATGYVAVAGSDRIAVVEVASHRIGDPIAAPGNPLGVAATRGGDLLVSRFKSDSVVRYETRAGHQTGALFSGAAGASLFHGPLPNGHYLVSVEQANRLLEVVADPMRAERAFLTGRRPFPPAATSDGRLAFVPNYDDGTVSVVDLWGARVLDSVSVGAHPSGGAVLPGDAEYGVVVRGENKVLFLNTASARVVDSIVEGIGESPFSLVLSPDGRLGFVNNTASHDISVIAFPERRVVARIPVADAPIVMAVHPSGKELWVSSEGVHRVTIIAIPERWRAASPSAAPDSGITEVAVLGMIHDGHLRSDRYGLAKIREIVRRFRPDAVCAEIPPDRWDRIWSDYTERGVIEDPRVRRFPEYVEVMLPLAVELGFEIVPCAAWTREMSDLREVRIKAFETEARFDRPRREYAKRLAAVRARYPTALTDIDDPAVIQSAEYDRRQREELELYDQYQNELIGPGGWSAINAAHLRLIDRAVRSHRGRRLLVTFGAGHKYQILDGLKGRPDVRLVDLRP